MCRQIAEAAYNNGEARLVMKRVSRSVTVLFTQAALEETLRLAQKSVNSDFGDLSFGSYQKEVLEAAFDGVEFDFLAVSTIDLASPDSPHSVLLGLDRHILKSYEQIAPYDVISPRVYSNPGRVVSHTDVLSIDAWLDHPFYRSHCRAFDIHNALMLSYPVPGRRNTVLAMEYLGAPNNRSWKCFDTRRLELATLPFALAWQFRRGLIDGAELAHRFMALSNLSETKLSHIRKYVNATWQGLSEQACSIGLKPAAFKDSLYTVRDTVADRFEWENVALVRDGARVPLRALEAEYGFMRMLGDPTTPLV